MKKSLSHISRYLLSVLAFCASPALFAAGEKAASVLASGHWAKIKVSEQGIHQVTPAQLEEWGFSDPSKVTVYGYGGTLALDNNFNASTPDDLVQIPSVHTSDGRILFYGMADVDVKMEYNATSNYFYASRLRNDYSLYGAYFITDSQEPIEIKKTSYNVSASGNIISTHAACAFVEDEAENPFGSRFFMGKRYSIGTTFNVVFSLSDYSASGFDYIRGGSLSTNTYPALYYSYLAKTTSVKSNLKPMLPAGVAERNASYVECSAQMESGGYRFGRSYGRTRLTSQDNSKFSNPEFTIRFSPSCSNPSKFEYGALDYASIIYPRKNSLANSPEVFMTFMCGNTNQKFEINGAPATTEVWKIVRPDMIYAYGISYSADRRTVTCSFDSSYTLTNQARVIAFDKAREHRAVEFMGQVANQNLHALSTPDFIIITPENYLAAAEQLARYHREFLGQDVVVATQEQIFNEFSSGTPAVNAYRRFAKMLYDRDPSRLKNILLYAAAGTDFRGITRVDADRLLTFQTDRLMEDVRLEPTCYSSDIWFGMLESDYNHAALFAQKTPVAVGRLPIRNINQAWAVNEKIRRYLANQPSPDVYSRAIVVADAGDNAVHEAQANLISDVFRKNSDAFSVALLCKAGLPQDNKGEYLKTQIKKQLYRGAGFFDYSGHANGTELSAQALWSSALAQSTPYSAPGIFMFSTCSAFCMPSNFASIAEACALAPEGGSIASIGASVSVYLEYNILYNLALTHSYVNAQNGWTIGDFMRDARQRMLDDPASSTAILINTIAYNLAGDPALPMIVAADKVLVESVDGIDATAEKIVLSPGKKTVFSGAVTDAGGAVLSGFNGKIDIAIYEAAEQTNSQEFDQYGNAQPVTLDHTILATASADVVDGRFSASVAIPVTDRPGLKNRVVFTAAPSDNSGAAMGALANISIADFDPEKAEFDNSAPEITELYINSPETADGSVVAVASSVHALFAASNGLSLSDNKIGLTPTLILDGTTSFPDIRSYISPVDDSTMKLEMPLDGIDPGRHTLVLAVADLAGARTRRSFSFVVGDASLEGSITSDAKTVSDLTTFTIELPGHEIAEGTLSITNAAGEHIASVPFSGNEASWDLTDADGNPVADATYHVSARFITASSLAGHTPAISLIAIR